MKLITTGELVEQTGFCRTSIWRFRQRHQDFPRPITINGIHIRWNSEEVERWFLSQRLGG